MIDEDFLNVTACVIAEDNGYKYRWSIKCISETLCSATVMVILSLVRALPRSPPAPPPLSAAAHGPTVPPPGCSGRV